MRPYRLMLEFGMLSPPIAEQLEKQGFAFVGLHEDAMQQDANSITRLYVRGLLTEAEAQKAKLRLVKAISEVVQKAVV